ncbi:3'-5' exonuclease [Rhizosphaericola mali]|uniref:3'-5' exonuclease n=1 Tax=Rhizosphaericola mali TaxID=2545455 RepID=A0A5P2FZK8_9BACT|nr:3'-5' exonuclease [Rhizosphaericola mali]QES87269.1 3'-5' exonuclease [Rhizosphaericola mali]
MNLELQRPIAFIDLETTGINISQDRIVEIAIIKIMPDGEQIQKRKFLNPEMPIPKASSDIHGITDEMVKDAPTFKQVANEVKQFLHNCDLGGYNSNKFDIPMLVEEFLRVGLDFTLKDTKLVDAQKIFFMMEPRNLTAAYKFYCDKELVGAHGALADVIATWEVLDAQVARYPNIGTTLDSILKFTGEDDTVDFARRMVKQKGVEVFNFGKYKGQAVMDVLKKEPQYYDWMMKSDFPLNTKQKLTEIYNRAILNKL